MMNLIMNHLMFMKLNLKLIKKLKNNKYKKIFVSQVSLEPDKELTLI